MMFARLAIEADAKQLITLAVGAAFEAYGDVADPRRLRAVFDRYLENADPTIFVCELHGIVIGFGAFQVCAFEHKAGLYTHQRALCVRPGSRGTRAAVLLMREFVSWSDRIGALQIHGGTSIGFRTRKMAAFLKRFGFEECGIVAKRSLDGGAGRQRDQRSSAGAEERSRATG